MGFNGPPFLTPLTDNKTWKLVQSIKYSGKEDSWIIPAGYETDLTSIPRFMEWLFRRYGAYTLAAILHDYLLTHPLQRKEISSRDVDGIFRRVMREEGVIPPVYWTLWAAVRLGALFNSKRAYKRGFLRDLPLITLVGVLAAPFIVWGVIGVLVSLALISPFTWWNWRNGRKKKDTRIQRGDAT